MHIIFDKLVTLFWKLKTYFLSRSTGSRFRFVSQGTGGIALSGNTKNFKCGKGIAFKSDTYFDCSGKITIGDFCHFGGNLTILTSEHNYDGDYAPYSLTDVVKDVNLASFSWLGRGVTIMPGTNIGRGSIVAAGSVVTRDVPDYEIFAGVPAKKIGVRDTTLFELNISEGRVQ